MGKRHELKSNRGRHKHGHKHMKKCSASLAIREIQIKITMRYHFTPVRVAKINKTEQMLERTWRKGNSFALLVGIQPGTATLENSVEVPQEVKIELPTLQPSNCTTGYLPQRYRCSEMMGDLKPSVHSSNVHNSQIVEGTTMAFDG